MSLPQVNDNGMACELAMGFAAEKACPVFRVSNVTGEGLELLKVRRGSHQALISSKCRPNLSNTLQSFLNVVRPAHSAEVFPVDADFELAVADVYSVPFVSSPPSYLRRGVLRADCERRRRSEPSYRAWSWPVASALATYRSSDPTR